MASKGQLRRINSIARKFSSLVIIDSTTGAVYRRNYDWEADMCQNLYDKIGKFSQQQIDSGQLNSQIMIVSDFGECTRDKWEPCNYLEVRER